MSPEAKRVVNYLAGMPSGNVTVEHKDAHDILLETGGQLLACGNLYNIEAKDIGAGVWRLYLSRWSTGHKGAS